MTAEDVKKRLMKLAREVDGLTWADRLCIGEAIGLISAPQPAEPEFFTVFAFYEGAGERGWIALPGYSNETINGVKNMVLEAARKEGYMGTVTGRLQELGWDIRPVYAAPVPEQAQPVAAPAVVADAKPADWRIDNSTPSPILVYKDCSVIQDEQAQWVLGLIRAALSAGGSAS